MEKITKKLPNKPGVYFFKKGKKILYIGKATNLNSRVKSYFTDDIVIKRSAVIKNMVEEATGVDFEVTDSALEALILEAHLIKRHQPRANVKEKDDKSFNYVVITKEDFPRVFTVRGKDLSDWQDEIKYSFGPFPKGTELKEALNIIRKIFPFRDKSSRVKHTSRFNQQIGLEPGEVSKKDYSRTIQSIKLFFQGKKGDLLKKLKKDMKDHSDKKEFERAAEIRNQIFALEHINDIALLKRDTESKYDSLRSFRIEAYDIAHTSGKETVGVMTVVVNGQKMPSEYKRFKIRGAGKDKNDDVKNLSEIIERRLEHPEWGRADLWVIDGGLAQKNRAEKILNDTGNQIPIVSVKKDERHRPKDILGEQALVRDYHHDILLANSEAHRFAISYHKRLRDKVK